MKSEFDRIKLLTIMSNQTVLLFMVVSLSGRSRHLVGTNVILMSLFLTLSEYGRYWHMYPWWSRWVCYGQDKLFLSPLCDVDVGEVVGLHTSIQWVGDLHYDHVDFVLDSKSVVERFNSNLMESSELGSIIQACRQLFGCNCRNSHVKFNRRQANGVAHELVRVASSYASSHVYDDVLSCIRDLIANEKQLIFFSKNIKNKNEVWI